MSPAEYENIVNSLNAIRATLAAQVMHLDSIKTMIPVPQKPQPVAGACAHPKSIDIGEMGNPLLRSCSLCGEEFQGADRR